MSEFGNPNSPIKLGNYVQLYTRRSIGPFFRSSLPLYRGSWPR